MADPKIVEAMTSVLFEHRSMPTGLVAQKLADECERLIAEAVQPLEAKP